MAEERSLPEDMIEETMSWLPVKSLLQFKCVSKSWYALSRNPYFVEQHRTRSPLRPDGTQLLLSYESYSEDEQTILTHSHDGGTATPTLPSIQEHGPFYLSCCEGLVSMHPREPPTGEAKAKTFVYNPSTRETLSIPFHTDAFEDYVSVRNYIGFEPVSKQYKLMLLGTWHIHGNATHCEIITLGTNNWRQVVTPPIQDADSTCLNGALHWLTSDRQRIVVFDLESEKFRTILGPTQIQEDERLKYKLRQVRGRLTLVESGTYQPEASFESWTLVDYYKGVWVKESINFSMPQDFLSEEVNGRCLDMVGGINNDELLISILPFEPQVFSYDMKAKKGRKVYVRQEHEANLENIMLYTESMRC